MLSDLYSTSLHLLRGGNLNFLQLADTGSPSDVVPARLKSHKSRQEHARKLKVNVLSITYAHILLRNNDPFRSIVLVDFCHHGQDFSTSNTLLDNEIETCAEM